MVVITLATSHSPPTPLHSACWGSVDGENRPVLLCLLYLERRFYLCLSLDLNEERGVAPKTGGESMNHWWLLLLQLRLAYHTGAGGGELKLTLSHSLFEYSCYFNVLSFDWGGLAATLIQRCYQST